MSDTALPQNAPFEAIVTRLETIAAQLEAGEVPLEQALSLFEEGVGLSKRGGQRLDEAEQRLEVLLADGRTEPLPTADDGPVPQGER